MNKDQIYQLLNKKKINATMIAKALGVSPSAVQRVIADGNTSERIAQAIANMCDTPMFEMFPYYAVKHQEKLERERIQQELAETLAKLA